IEYDKLARRDGPLWLIKPDFTTSAGYLLDDTGLIGLAVAGFGETLKWCIRQVSADPVQIGRSQALAIEQGMIMSLTDIKDVVVDVLANYIPWLFIGALDTTDPQSLPLAQRVIKNPVVCAHGFPFHRFYFARLFRNKPAQEFPEWT